LCLFIDPEEAKVAVPDERFELLQRVFQSKATIPSYLTVTDIAGLVRGASEGAGLGNAFLNHVRSVDGIFHLCRGFENSDIVHVEDNRVDPVRDLAIIHDELRLKDAEYLEQVTERLKKEVEKTARVGNAALTKMKREEYVSCVQCVF
jgi:obg-like ATPase 1